MAHYQNFVELSNKGNVVRVAKGMSCFGSRQMLQNKDIQFLEYYPNPRGLDYSGKSDLGQETKGLLDPSKLAMSQAEEIEYLQYLQDMGIPFTYSVHDSWKTFANNGSLNTFLLSDLMSSGTDISRLAIRINKDELNCNNTLILTVLNIFRFLTEQPGVCMNFIQLVRDNPKVEKFQLFQIAMLTARNLFGDKVRWDSYPTSGHSLYGRTDIYFPEVLPTWEELIDHLRMTNSRNNTILNVNWTFDYRNWSGPIVKTVIIDSSRSSKVLKEVQDIYGIMPQMFESELHDFKSETVKSKVA